MAHNVSTLSSVNDTVDGLQIVRIAIQEIRKGDALVGHAPRVCPLHAHGAKGVAKARRSDLHFPAELSRGNYISVVKCGSESAPFRRHLDDSQTAYGPAFNIAGGSILKVEYSIDLFTELREQLVRVSVRPEPAEDLGLAYLAVLIAGVVRIVEIAGLNHYLVDFSHGLSLSIAASASAPWRRAVSEAGLQGRHAPEDRWGSRCSFHNSQSSANNIHEAEVNVNIKYPCATCAPD